MGPAEDAKLDCKPPMQKSAVGETESQSDLLAICADISHHLSYLYSSMGSSFSSLVLVYIIVRNDYCIFNVFERNTLYKANPNLVIVVGYSQVANVYGVLIISIKNTEGSQY